MYTDVWSSIPESQKAKGHVISALCVIGQSSPSQRSLHRQLVSVARKVALFL